MVVMYDNGSKLCMTTVQSRLLSFTIENFVAWDGHKKKNGNKKLF